MTKSQVTVNPRRWAILSGVFMIVLGMIAIALPMMMSLTLELFLGWLLLFGGILQVVSAVYTRHREGFFMHLLAGIIYFVLGGFLLVNPVRGVAVLTLILTISFAIQSIIKIIAAVQLRPEKGWLWIMINGIITGLLAAIICWDWAHRSLWIIGLLFGINLLFIGWSVVMIATSPGKE